MRKIRIHKSPTRTVKAWTVTLPGIGAYHCASQREALETTNDLIHARYRFAIAA